MKVITSRPIMAEPTSNCCGMSNFDDEIDAIPTELAEYNDSLGDDMSNNAFSFATGQVKGYLGAEKTKRKSFQQEYVGDVLADKSQSKDARRKRLTEKREARQLARSERKEARFQRNAQRKAKKNSKRLALIKTQGSEKYFFPINRLRLGKKKYKDGTEAEIKKEDQLSIIAPNGESVVVDRKEVAKAIGTTPNNVSQADVQKVITVIPPKTAIEQNMNTEVGQAPNEPVLAVQVPDNNVEANANGELYLPTDLQNVNETEKDVKEEEKGLTKTQKIVLWSAVGVATIIVGYIIYKSVTKNK